MECKHLNFLLRRSDERYYVYCPDCKKLIPLWEAFNNLAFEMRRVLFEFQKDKS